LQGIYLLSSGLAQVWIDGGNSGDLGVYQFREDYTVLFFISSLLKCKVGLIVNCAGSVMRSRRVFRPDHWAYKDEVKKRTASGAASPPPDGDGVFLISRIKSLLLLTYSHNCTIPDEDRTGGMAGAQETFRPKGKKANIKSRLEVLRSSFN